MHSPNTLGGFTVSRCSRTDSLPVYPCARKTQRHSVRVLIILELHTMYTAIHDLTLEPPSTGTSFPEHSGCYVSECSTIVYACRSIYIPQTSWRPGFLIKQPQNYITIEGVTGDVRYASWVERGAMSVPPLALLARLVHSGGFWLWLPHPLCGALRIHHYRPVAIFDEASDKSQ